jgi:hypothetical protein
MPIDGTPSAPPWAMVRVTDGVSEAQPPDVGALLQGIGKDLRVIATDEVELIGRKLTASTRQFVIDASAATLAAVVALIGFALLCTAAVAGAAPLIPALWLRLLVMAGIYVAVGGVIAYQFASRMRASGAGMAEPVRAVKRTLASISSGLGH